MDAITVFLQWKTKYQSFKGQRKSRPFGRLFFTLQLSADCRSLVRQEGGSSPRFAGRLESHIGEVRLQTHDLRGEDEPPRPHAHDVGLTRRKIAEGEPSERPCLDRALDARAVREYHRCVRESPTIRLEHPTRKIRSTGGYAERSPMIDVGRSLFEIRTDVVPIRSYDDGLARHCDSDSEIVGGRSVRSKQFPLLGPCCARPREDISRALIAIQGNVVSNCTYDNRVAGNRNSTSELVVCLPVGGYKLCLLRPSYTGPREDVRRALVVGEDVICVTALTTTVSPEIATL